MKVPLGWLLLLLFFAIQSVACHIRVPCDFRTEWHASPWPTRTYNQVAPPEGEGCAYRPAQAEASNRKSNQVARTVDTRPHNRPSRGIALPFHDRSLLDRRAPGSDPTSDLGRVAALAAANALRGIRPHRSPTPSGADRIHPAARRHRVQSRSLASGLLDLRTKVPHQCSGP
jgi:hypothetical protein